MRAGVIISAVSHVLLVLLALFGTPKLFDSVQLPSIEVDLVSPDEVPSPKPEPEPEKQKPPDWGLPAAQSAPPAQARAEPPLDNSQQAALAPPRQPSSAPEPKPEAPKAAPSIFDPASIPMLLDLPNAPEKGFDSEATARANLSAEERAAFKAHLRKCWKLPAGLSPAQTTRVVLRIYLRRDARLAGDPVLIEASASRDGPVLLQTAMRAVKDCQPFGFLSPDKYGEWKILDLSFTPRDMAGG
jgi:hypothetical protein